jgi:hypothetical protein
MNQEQIQQLIQTALDAAREGNNETSQTFSLLAISCLLYNLDKKWPGEMEDLKMEIRMAGFGASFPVPR